MLVKIPASEELEIYFIHPQDEKLLFLNQQLSISYTEIVQFEKEPAKAFVDVKDLIFPLILRVWQEGDKFIPLGMKTYKKLSNFFIDQKVPVNEKRLVPILVNGNGEIIWVGGYRQDDRFKITGSTTSLVVFELTKP